jgi:hypothetical protein
MGKMVEITLPIEAEAAAKLRDDSQRLLMGRDVRGQRRRAVAMFPLPRLGGRGWLSDSEAG